MGWKRGTLRQPFKIRVDVEKLVDFITDKITEQIASDKEIDSVRYVGNIKRVVIR